jgi:hypothetical protein
MRDFYYLCAPNFKIKNYGGSSILQLPVWIADMAPGWLAGQAARDFTPTDMSTLNGINIEESDELKTTKYFCKTNFDMEKIKQEESYYVDLPKIYAFTSEREKEVMLNRNFKRVNDEVKAMINELLGKAPEE